MDRSVKPQPQAPRTFNFPEFKRFRLENGLQVLFAGHRKLPLISAELVVHCGANYDSHGEEGLASFTADMLAEGTKKYSSFEISNGFENLGTQFSSHAEWNTSYVEMQLVKKHFIKSMDLFCEVLFNPVFDQHEIERLRKQHLNRRLRVADNAATIAGEKFNSVLFPGSRYAEPIGGRAQQIRNITRDKCEQFYYKFYRPQNCTLILVGDLEFNDVKKMAQSYFADWQHKDASVPEEDVFLMADKQIVHLVHKAEAQQAEIRVGHLGIQRHNPDFYACSVLNQILGGYFLSRLNQNLREDKGYTYGIHSRFVTRKGIGPFQISSAIETQYIFNAVQEIIREMRTIVKEPVSDTELEQAKGYMTGIFPIAFESSTQIAAGLSSLVEHELPDDYFRTYKDNIMAVTKEQVLESAQKYLHPDNLSVVICTDISALEKEFKTVFEVETSEFKEE